jgi:hypothetical protein
VGTIVNGQAIGSRDDSALRKFKLAIRTALHVGGEKASMNDKKFVAVFGSVLLLTLATGRVWANSPIVSTGKLLPKLAAPITPDSRAALGDTIKPCPRVASLRVTGSSDAARTQNDAVATQHAQIATLEINLLSQNPWARSTRNLSAVSPLPRRSSPTGSNQGSAYSTFARTGSFGGEAERVTTKAQEGKVKIGVFWTPQGSPGGAQGDDSGNAFKSGFWGLPGGPGVTKETGDRHGVQGRQLRKRGRKSGN